MARRRAAVLDVGSLSVLLAVGERDEAGGLRIIDEESRVVRLAEGLRETGMLTSSARERTVDAIRELSERARAAGADTIAAAGTAALRDATDPSTFVAEVRQKTGVTIDVVDARREADLSFRGVLSGMTADGPLAVVDVGGGSAEITVGTRAGVLASTSLPLGALRLAARFPEDALEALAEHVTARLPDGHAGRDPRGARPIGVGGTITTLGALDLRLTPYDGRRLLGHVLTRDRIANLRAELSARSLEDRRRDPILERGRADVIVQGAVVYECVLDHYRWDAIEISPRGLRQGLLAEILRVDEGGPS